MSRLQPFNQIKYKALPKLESRYSLENNVAGQQFFGDVRIEFDNGGFMILGHVGNDSNGVPMFGILVNDGTTNRMFAGVQTDGF